MLNRLYEVMSKEMSFSFCNCNLWWHLLHHTLGPEIYNTLQKVKKKKLGQCFSTQACDRVFIKCLCSKVWAL